MRDRLLACLVALLVASSAWLAFAAANGNAIRLTNVTQASGIRAEMRCGSPEKRWIPEANGSGVAWLDYDNDGLMDLLLVNGGDMTRLRTILGGKEGQPAKNAIYIFHNLGNGKFADVTEHSGLVSPYWGTGANVTDYDNDGYPDILVTSIGRDLLFHNNHNGTFTEVSRSAGLNQKIAWHTGSAWGDYDNDGFPDFYVSGYVDLQSLSWNEPVPVCPFAGVPAFCGPIGLKPARGKLYHNNGDGTFTDVTDKSGLLKAPAAHGFTPVFDDFNNDGKPDLFIANDSDPNQLFLNNGDGTFRESALDSGIAVNGNGKVQSNMGVAISRNASGQMSVVTTTFMNDYYPLYRQDKSGYFEETASEAGLTSLTHHWLGWACGFTDFANTGRRDLWLANGHVYPRAASYFQPIAVLRPNGQQFETAWQYPAVPDNSYRGGASADFDNDGGVDLVVLPINGQPLLFKNETVGGNWIGFRLIGTRSNRDALGARLRIEYCGQSAYDSVRNGGSYLSRNDPRLHFGLGACDKVDKVTVHWPAGGESALVNIAAGRYVTIIEPH